MNNTIRPISYTEQKFVYVDKWIPKNEDIVFKNCKDAILLPVSQYYGITNLPGLDYFMVSPKRCYNSNKMRSHTCHYLNYFLKFYDYDKELLLIYYRIKYLIDFENGYNEDAYIADICNYILSNSILYKVYLMNRDNYKLNLQYKNKKNPSLQYTNKHGKILMMISILMNILIPLTCHFIYVKGIDSIDNFLLKVYDILFEIFDVDIYNKFYETSVTNVNKSKKNHSPLWAKQAIREKNVTTHSIDSVINIILQIMPKYVYSENIISFNYRSIVISTGFQIENVEYEYSFVPLSSSKRDLLKVS